MHTQYIHAHKHTFTCARTHNTRHMYAHSTCICNTHMRAHSCMHDALAPGHVGRGGLSVGASMLPAWLGASLLAPGPLQVETRGHLTRCTDAETSVPLVVLTGQVGQQQWKKTTWGYPHPPSFWRTLVGGGALPLHCIVTPVPASVVSGKQSAVSHRGILVGDGLRLTFHPLAEMCLAWA